MKRILTILLILSSCIGFSQNLILTGNLVSFDNLKKRVVYYKEFGTNSPVVKIIRCDDSSQYTIKFPLQKLKKDNITTIVFSMDSASVSTNQGCVQRVFVDQIINSPEFANLKTIKLKSDFLFDYLCISRMGIRASEEGGQDFVGKYEMKKGDTLHSITLDDLFYRYSAKLLKPTSEYMTEAFGIWEIDGINNMIIFKISRHLNSKYGIMVLKKISYSFKIKDYDKKLFDGINSTLSKL